MPKVPHDAPGGPPWRKAGHEAAGRATVGSVIVGSRQVTMAGVPARSHGLRVGALERLAGANGSHMINEM
jgi:hypothetical protein